MESKKPQGKQAQPAAKLDGETRPEASALEAGDALLAELAGQWPFGLVFFLRQLGGFVRDRCPDPGDELPVVEIHLVDGSLLDLCHVMGVAPTWVALVVNEFDPGDERARMRTEFVPYGRIVQVTVRARRNSAPRVGFTLDHSPDVIAGSPKSATAGEDTLLAAADPAASDSRRESRTAVDASDR